MSLIKCQKSCGVEGFRPDELYRVLHSSTSSLSVNQIIENHKTIKLINKKTESSFKVRWVLSLVGFPCGCLRLSFPSISPAAQRRILQPRAAKTYWTKKQKQKRQQKLQSRPLCSTLNRESQHLARTLTHSPDSYRQKLESQHWNLWHINPTVCLERRHVPESWNVSKHQSLNTEISINWWNF